MLDNGTLEILGWILVGFALGCTTMLGGFMLLLLYAPAPVNYEQSCTRPDHPARRLGR